MNFFPAKFGQRYVNIHFPLPRSLEAVKRLHGCDGGAGRAAAAITGVKNSRPGNRFSKAILTHAAIAAERGRHAHQAEIMQRLHHRRAFLVRRVISGGGDERERVVKMHDLRADFANRFANGLSGLLVPNCFPGDGQLAHGFHLVIVHGETPDAVAMLLQQAALGREDMVFAARLLIEIMSEEHIHNVLRGLVEQRDANM